MAFKLYFTLLFILLIGFTTLRAQNTEDELTAYIERLRTSYAAGGSETAFMSEGSAFLYAQEYFEAKNYSSAEYSFASIVRGNKNHAFANYQLAISLIRQHNPEKTKQAEAYLLQAFALNPSLKNRYNLDVPPTKDPASASAPETIHAKDTTLSVAKGSENQQSNVSKLAAQNLDAYVSSLKHSYATGGKETQMFAPGQEAHYGIQYFEKGEFDSAESRFSQSLAVDAQNPYVNYLKAVSLAAQGKTSAAKPFYEKAVAGDVSLQKRYSADVASGKAKWGKLQSAKAVKTTPATKTTYGGALVYGSYTCDQSIWNGPNASPAYRYDYKGYFLLKKDGTYRWLDDGGTGKYKYDPKTGTITWLSGPMKSKAPRSTKYQPGTKVAQISVSFSDNYNWECGCNKK